MTTSLSARRAWIEISKRRSEKKAIPVALRKESVDRNTGNMFPLPGFFIVALRKESVDRNTQKKHPLT